MKKFNSAVVKLKQSQKKLELMLFPEHQKVSRAAYFNCYIPVNRLMLFDECYFENVIFTGHATEAPKSNYYTQCSFNGFEFDPNRKQIIKYKSTKSSILTLIDHVLFGDEQLQIKTYPESGGKAQHFQLNT